jgi:hypothetical protein
VIPNLIDLINSPWKVLPQGIHNATLVEVEAMYATTPYRRELFNGLVLAAIALAASGCPSLYLDGSYVTGKPKPSDFDGCWDPAGVNPALLDPVLLDFSNKRQNQKNKYKGGALPFSKLCSTRNILFRFFSNRPLLRMS